MSDPRTPVIIGVAQKTYRAVPGPEPLDAWAEVSRIAAADATLDENVLRNIDALLMTTCRSWRYDDGPRRLAERIGATPRLREVTAGGSAGQKLVDKAADEIRSGRADLVLVCGGEANASRKKYDRAGELPPWSWGHPDGQSLPVDVDAMQHPAEVEAGLTAGVGAVYSYAMRDIARRAYLGVSPEGYLKQLGETMAGMTRVAAANPDAWFRDPRNPEELTTPSPTNLPISYPYTKLMTAMMDVDMSMAVIVVSESWADQHNIPRDRRVYPWTSCQANDPYFLAVRNNLWKSDAMEAASTEALEAANLTIRDIAYLDLYTCFPSAVNFSRDALGISNLPGDKITLTGGLAYGGGPASSATLCSIVKMVTKLRSEPGAHGLVSGVSFWMAHHVYAIYSSQPPGTDVRPADNAAAQARVDAIPRREIDQSYSGPATIATYTIMYHRDMTPSHGVAICDLPTGDRCYAKILDPEFLREAQSTELVGRTFTIDAGPKTVKELISTPVVHV